MEYIVIDLMLRFLSRCYAAEAQEESERSNTEKIRKQIKIENKRARIYQ